jgi:CheY-like chemotaxis protein
MMTPEKSVLVVDDILEARTLLRILLSRKGHFTVYEAENGRDAMEKLQRVIPDLVVLDYMMPDMNGAELCRHLRVNLPTAQIPIIVLTARTDYDTRDKALAAGADIFMNKPLRPTELLEAASQLVDQGRSVAAVE